MVDDDGVEKVILNKEKPTDFERAEGIVLKGKADGEIFYATSILMKCPSKYNEQQNLISHIMTEINYINENTFLGQLGHGAVLFALTALSAVLYYFNQKNENNNFLQLSRISFILHSSSVFLIMGLLAYAIISHSYEYSYPWKYSSNEMSLKYIFSCFWAVRR